MTSRLFVKACVMAMAATVGAAAPARAQSMTSVSGTNDSMIDVPAVQYAVDNFDVVHLRGTFSFAAKPGLARDYVDITRQVAVVGASDEDGVPAWIVGGTRPFRVNAHGQAVSVGQLGFAQPRLIAIEVTRVWGLTVERCTVAEVIRGTVTGLPASVPGAYGIAFASVTGEIGGDVVLRGNDITIGGTAAQRTAGIINMPAAFAPETSLRITHNTIRDTTAHGIDIRNVRGAAVIEHNSILTGPVGAQPAAMGTQDTFVDGIRCLGAGAYRILKNEIEMPFTNGAGIRLQGNSATQPVTGAVVEGNLVRMSNVNGSFGPQSAGIDLRRHTIALQVGYNSFEGFARAAVVVESDVLNLFSRDAHVYHRRPPAKSKSPLSGPDMDIFVAAGSLDTVVTLGTADATHESVFVYNIDDKGTGTVVTSPGRQRP